MCIDIPVDKCVSIYIFEYPASFWHENTIDKKETMLVSAVEKKATTLSITQKKPGNENSMQ